ncbi:MAG TPA: hypothetical protein VND54_12015 [Candidatus Saccharimonadales bacterium]|nr:hypothetical protein [Candidatus Saccharimonadales bacterium]
MAVRVLPAGTIGIPLKPAPAPEPPPLEVEDEVPTLHLVGRSEQRLAQALFETDAVDEPYSPDTVRALRLLAMDNLVDIIQLREAVQERDAQVAALSAELDLWRTRAVEEHAQRDVEQREAVRRERELVTVLHNELIRNETLSGELAWRRKPWFRRVGRH